MRNPFPRIRYWFVVLVFPSRGTIHPPLPAVLILSRPWPSDDWADQRWEKKDGQDDRAQARQSRAGQDQITKSGFLHTHTERVSGPGAAGCAVARRQSRFRPAFLTT